MGVIRANHLWDGVRKLPYSNEQISYAFAETVSLWHESSGGRGYSVNQGLPAAKTCFGDDVIELEFGAADGSYSRAYASTEMLTRAIRSDIKDYLVPSWANIFALHPVNVVQVIRTARLLFDFTRLAV
jgi:hypothetical protein